MYMKTYKCANRACGPYKSHHFLWRGKAYCSPWCAKNEGKAPDGIKRQLFKERRPKKR